MVGKRSLQGKGHLMSEVASNLHQLQKMEMIALGVVGQPPSGGLSSMANAHTFQEVIAVSRALREVQPRQ